MFKNTSTIIYRLRMLAKVGVIRQGYPSLPPSEYSWAGLKAYLPC